jgi:hypothetical protein
MQLETEWQVFWRITFDVVEGVLRLRQEVTWWEASSDDNEGILTRRERIIEDLPYTLHGNVKVERDRAVFRGGYLEGRTLDLLAYVQRRLSPTTNLTALSNSTLGETIAIWADVKPYPTEDGVSPIFYMPQPNAPAGLRLLEVTHGEQRRWIQWHISNQEAFSEKAFRLAHFDDWHAVRVRQDIDTAKQRNVYEFLVDAIALGSEEANPEGHDFGLGSHTFYIGATPDHLGGLYGEISYLDFDPNDSCGSC